MRKVLAGLAALPFMLGVASAGQPLTNQQMDTVTAGFSAISLATATGLAGESGIVFTTATTNTQVAPIAKTGLNITVPCNCGTDTSIPSEGTSTLFGSLSQASSVTVTSSYSPSAIPVLVLPPCGC
jgi:hypothetical protein